jgi:hypothetical protein
MVFGWLAARHIAALAGQGLPGVDMPLAEIMP